MANTFDFVLSRRKGVQYLEYSEVNVINGVNETRTRLAQYCTVVKQQKAPLRNCLCPETGQCCSVQLSAAQTDTDV